MEKDKKRELMRLSLLGLSLGDAFGDQFFAPTHIADAYLAERKLPNPPWRFTDDTVMAIAIAENLEAYGKIDQTKLAKTFAAKYTKEPWRKYGATAHGILQEIEAGSDWRTVSQAVFSGMGSMGNGGAMRAAPLGAYFHEDLQLAASEASLSAEVTHANIEGQAGAIAIAIAAAHVASGGEQDRLFETVLDFLPTSDTKRKIATAANLPLDYDVRTAVNALGNGCNLTSQDTVPLALWCAMGSLENYEEAMWKTVSAEGDRDTLCAIVGGIVALVDEGESIPKAWLKCCESLSCIEWIGME